MNDAIYERRRGDLLLTTDRARLDVDRIHRVLTTTYWAGGTPRERNSLCHSERAQL